MLNVISLLETSGPLQTTNIKYTEKNFLARRTSCVTCVTTGPTLLQISETTWRYYIGKIVLKFFTFFFQVKHSDRMYYCDKCDFKSPYKGSANSHKKIHDEDSWFQVNLSVF